MFEELVNHRDHIPPHLFWGLKHYKLELDPSELAHLIECEHCREVLELFLQAPTFGEALVVWSKQYRTNDYAA
jgi:hypothetical protein